MTKEGINLTGKWIVASWDDGVPYKSGMELVHHGNRVMGREVGGDSEYFLEGEIVGNVGTVKYSGILYPDQRTGKVAGEAHTGTYHFHIKDGGELLDGHYADESDPVNIDWSARRDRP